MLLTGEVSTQGFWDAAGETHQKAQAGRPGSVTEAGPVEGPGPEVSGLSMLLSLRASGCLVVSF